MKQLPEKQSLHANMLPGKFSLEGFLGEDSRSLTDILLDDQRQVDSMNLTHADIAGKMASLTDLGKTGLGRPVAADSFFEVTVEDYMGRIPCPFRDNRRSGKRSTTVTRISTQKTMQWTDLNIHMIEKHGFYEGKGSPYRLEPLELAEFLGLR